VNVFAIPVRRLVATAMFFIAIFLLGYIALQRIPVELFPQSEGNQLQVTFARPGSDAEVVEREILMPLEARAGELSDIKETSGQVRGATGSFTIIFEPGTDISVRELELTRLASELTREQPPGTFINVQADPFTQFTQSGFAMYLQISGMSDRNSLLDFVNDRIVPRLAAVPGVSQAQAFGGAPREMTVWVDPDRCAAVGVTPGQVTAALSRSVKRLEFLGGVEDEAGRTALVLDGRPRGVVSLANTRIVRDRPVLLRHVADVELGNGREESTYRVDGKPAVGVILFQDEEANLVRLAHDLRERLDLLRTEFASYGIGFRINFDGGELIENQLDRLKRLALSGFLIALAALYLFLRQWRAVAVVAVAVPASLLCALALLYLAGQTLNMVTLFGLAIGIGMLVDNSIVVYEAVQRQLEHGADPDTAAEMGIRRTVRAILAATLTNAIVFLPVTFIDFDNSSFRSLLQVMALSILLPLGASMLVAIGLVPLLARRLAAPAAVKRLAMLRKRRESTGGIAPPDRMREVFSAILTVALRRPGGWVTGVTVSVLITMLIAVSWVAVGASNSEPPEVTQIRFPVQFDSTQSFDQAVAGVAYLEEAVMQLEGVEQVEAFVQEQFGQMTVHIPPRGERPEELTASRVRALLREKSRELPGVTLTTTQAQQGGIASVLGQGPAEVVISGRDSRQLKLLAEDIKAQLESIDEVESAVVQTRASQDEIRVTPDARSLESYGLTADQVLPILNLIRREGATMRTGFTLQDGREIPMTVRRIESAKRSDQDLRRLRLATPAGVLPLSAVADVHRMPPPPTIEHKDGRREIQVNYTLSSEAPDSGPARAAVEEEIRQAIQQVHRPLGYTVEAPEPGESLDWFKKVLVPVLLLLYAILAITFESLTLPLLVLIALPLTVLGATWALLFAGTPLDPMAMVGVLALIGLTVNPAILLVDRMQQRAWAGGRSAGAAALAAVRERARPVLMTAVTTIVGMWPLSLVTGQENEIWPPFATVVMGGLATSTLLTLLVIPVGFVFLHRLDRIFGRVGPWIGMAWVGTTAAILTPLFLTGVVSSTYWRVISTLLLGAILLAVAVLLFRRVQLPEPHSEDGPPDIDVRYLHKVYGKPGPVGRAWRGHQRFAQRVLRLGGQPFSPADARGRIVPLLLIFSGALYLAFHSETSFWEFIFLFVAAALAAAAIREFRRSRGKADELGRVLPGGVEGWLAAAAPWVALTYFTLTAHLLPRLLDEGVVRVRLWLPITSVVVLALIQFGRHTALRLSRGEIKTTVNDGATRHVRTLWRRISRFCFGRDLPREEVHALRGVEFNASRGMVGVLGPNGAGKTTLLRMLSGILDPSSGTVSIGGVPLKKIRKYLARYVGYLPQDFGLPDNLTAREYLEYYGLLYEIKPAAKRQERIDGLLKEVGLADRADEKIGEYSGGMRQRVAVARTLLRLPPIIIVDEPTVGLDPRERIRFRNLLSRLAEGRVVLFSTHVVEDVEVACERVIVFAQGRIVFDGKPEDLAHEAVGRVWMLSLVEGQEDSLPSGAMIVDQVPDATGALRSRVLSEERPQESAEQAPPTLEDGYLWLVGDGVRA